MESKTLLCIFILIATIAAIDADKAITRDIVIGDDKGWNFGVNITEWMSVTDIIYGDKLIFNYPVGKGNVVEVDGNSYATCTVPPNAKVLSSGHDIVEMDIRGRRCFISGVENGRHCKEGLKFCIYIPEKVQDCPFAKLADTNVSHQVGLEQGWRRDIDYQAWAKDIEFRVKDKLIFRYPPGAHNVIEVDESGVNQCKIPEGDEAMAGAYTTGFDEVYLERVGGYGFISGIEKDCEMGMKLFINVLEKKPKPLKGARKLVPPKE